MAKHKRGFWYNLMMVFFTGGLWFFVIAWRHLRK